jgi:hypothetical protein
MIRTKELLAEQRSWEETQDPVQLGELIKQYLTERRYGNQNSESQDKRLQSNKRLRERN